MFPLLLFVILGIVDFGFLFQRMEVVTNAAREGARIAVLPGYCRPMFGIECEITSRRAGFRRQAANSLPATVADTTITVTAGPPAVTYQPYEWALHIFTTICSWAR